jgi:tetratricopeptide (TPR) repeat protein
VELALDSAHKEESLGYRLYALGAIYHVAGRHEEADRALNDLIHGASGGESWAIQIAFVYAIRNELDEAFHWLNRAFELRDAGTIQVHTAAGWDHVRADSRYPQYLKKIGYPG